MPTITEATSWQRETLQAIADAVGVTPIHNGASDDHYKFSDGKIFGYVKLFSDVSRAEHPGGIKAIVESKTFSRVREDLADGNNWHGKPSRHRIFKAGDTTAAETASKILREARENRRRT